MKKTALFSDIAEAPRTHRAGTCALFFLLATLFAPLLTAQQIQGVQLPHKKDHVDFLPETQTIPALKPATLTLHFVVQNGFHINSHTPRGESLIPTKIAIEDSVGFNVKSVDFPRGTEYSFSFSPKEKLDVYTGDLVLTVHLTAKPGAHTLKGAFHYQACDSASCFPPRTLPVEASFTAK